MVPDPVHTHGNPVGFRRRSRRLTVEAVAIRTGACWGTHPPAPPEEFGRIWPLLRRVARHDGPNPVAVPDGSRGVSTFADRARQQAVGKRGEVEAAPPVPFSASQQQLPVVPLRRRFAPSGLPGARSAEGKPEGAWHWFALPATIRISSVSDGAGHGSGSNQAPPALRAPGGDQCPGSWP